MFIVIDPLSSIAKNVHGSISINDTGADEYLKNYLYRNYLLGVFEGGLKTTVQTQLDKAVSNKKSG